MDLHTEDPRSPDVRVGKIFDHHWELLSFLVPMAIVKGAVKRHFQRKVGDVVFMNLSRLVSQWEGIVHASASRRILSLYSAENRRRVAFATTSTSGELSPSPVTTLDELHPHTLPRPLL